MKNTDHSNIIKRNGNPRTKFVALFVAALAACSFLPNIALAYDPPIGIPAPSFGIDETAPAWPAQWPGAEVANYYYIDNTHPAATDTGNTYGYPDRPRATIPEITYAAGAYVEVHGGPYTDTNILLTFNGTAANPVWFRGTASSMPTITGYFSIRNNSSYAILEYLDFNGGNSGCIGVVGSSNYISIRNSFFRNRAFINNTAGISIIPNQGEIVHDIVVYNNEFSYLGDWQAIVDEDFTGIQPQLWNRTAPTEEYNIWILENTIHHISGSGVLPNGGNWTDSYKYLHHIYIGKNTAYNNRQSGFWSKQANHVIMSQNLTYLNRKSSGQLGDGMGYMYGPDNVWIIFNEIYDSNFGIRQSSTPAGVTDHKAYIIGNIIHNIHPEAGLSYNPGDPWRPGQAISLWEGGMQRYVINNTIFDVTGGINLIQSGPTTVANNIVYDIDPVDYHLAAWNAAPVTDVSYSSFYDPGGSARFIWPWGTPHLSLAAFQAATGECAGCSDAYPSFVNDSDYVSPDLHLQGGSSAIDTGVGVVDAIYTTFETLYPGQSIRRDFDGNGRPAGPWDMGAYEYGAGPPGPPLGGGGGGGAGAGGGGGGSSTGSGVSGGGGSGGGGGAGGGGGSGGGGGAGGSPGGGGSGGTGVSGGSPDPSSGPTGGGAEPTGGTQGGGGTMPGSGSPDSRPSPPVGLRIVQ